MWVESRNRLSTYVLCETRVALSHPLNRFFTSSFGFPYYPARSASGLREAYRRRKAGPGPDGESSKQHPAGEASRSRRAALAAPALRLVYREVPSLADRGLLPCDRPRDCPDPQRFPLPQPDGLHRRHPDAHLDRWCDRGRRLLLQAAGGQGPGSRRRHHRGADRDGRSLGSDADHHPDHGRRHDPELG